MRECFKKNKPNPQVGVIALQFKQMQTVVHNLLCMESHQNLHLPTSHHMATSADLSSQYTGWMYAQKGTKRHKKKDINITVVLIDPIGVLLI